MRRAAKTDRNQIEIVSALRELGASVAPLHQVGGGIPDLIVGYRGQNFLVEIKAEAKSKLTACQVEWHGSWSGQVSIIRSVSDAIELLQTPYKHPTDSMGPGG